MSTKSLPEIQGGACLFGRCKCKTQMGVRCKKCASPGSEYCYLHLNCADPATGAGVGMGAEWFPPMALPTMGRGVSPSRADDWDSKARMKIEHRARMYAGQLSNGDISRLVPSLTQMAASATPNVGSLGTLGKTVSAPEKTVASVASPLLSAANVAMNTMGAAAEAGTAALTSVIDAFAPAALRPGPAIGLPRKKGFLARGPAVDVSDATSFFDDLVGLPRTGPTAKELYEAGY